MAVGAIGWMGFSFTENGTVFLWRRQTGAEVEDIGMHLEGRDRCGKLPISPVKMLLGREFNYSGRGWVSLSDCTHVLSLYLPIYSPSVIDEMKSCAHTSQFSADGSFLVAAAQRGQVRIYDVDWGWVIHRDIPTIFSHYMRKQHSKQN